MLSAGKFEQMTKSFIVTGCAGFIGAKTTELLLRQGHKVIGIDALIDDLYPNSYKLKRLEPLNTFPNFEFNKLNLVTDEISHLFENIDAVFHFAAMAGLAKSWTHPEIYELNNVTATSKLVEALKSKRLPHLIHASTSSVYGEFAKGDENTEPSPVSPYGETKLLAENLIREYSRTHGGTYTILRFFSVFGPQQRPDMAYSKFCNAILSNSRIRINGTGRQSRSNTFIDDAANAAILAEKLRPENEIINIAGNEAIELLEALNVLSNSIGIVPNIEFGPPVEGDQAETFGNIAKAKILLNWEPQFPVKEGLKIQALAAKETFYS